MKKREFIVGKRGPQKTPTAQLKLHGSWRAKTRDGEPLPPDGMPECPSWVTGEARNTWDRLSVDLYEMGVMTKIDNFAFARYCLYGVLWLKELSNPGRTEATLERYANQLNRLEQSFGLTPSSRASLKTEESKKDDPLDALLKRRSG